MFNGFLLRDCFIITVVCVHTNVNLIVNKKAEKEEKMISKIGDRENETEEYEINKNKFSENETSQTDCYDEDDIEKANALQGKKECIIDILLGLKDRIESKELFTVKDICDRANTLLGVQVNMSQMIVKLLISGGQFSEKKIQRSKIYIRSCITFCIMGQKKTPLHVLTGVAVHATSKSASLVKSLNKSDDLIWALSQLKLSDGTEKLLEKQEFQEIPNWSAFNSICINDTRSQQAVGFLQYSTVYTNLCNFNDVLAQLSQSSLPVFCDEGVYHIAKHIQMIRKEEFRNLVIMLGNFHLLKVLLACVGKYLRDSGVEDLFVETKAYGVCTVNQVMNETSYARSMKGFQMLVMQNTIKEKAYDETKCIFGQIKNQMGNFASDFELFIERRSDESPLFKYYNNVLKMIQLIQDSVRADREGNWKLHIETVGKAQPLFHALDRSNYARWCSVYFNDMLMLPETHPQVYEEFISGQYSVKQRGSSFTSVAPDQALEQTINRDKKKFNGVIGMTRKKESIASWDLTYYKTLAITNLFRKITGVMTIMSSKHIMGYHLELLKKHMIWSTSLLIIFVNMAIRFKQDHKLYVTSQPKSFDVYKKFCLKRFEKKEIPLSSTISKVYLPSFRALPQETPKQVSKARLKEKQSAHQIIELAMKRGFDMKILLSYELTENNILFKEPGILCKEATKSTLANELFTVLDKDISETSEQQSTSLADFCLVL
ncbi:hypothetical protein RF55_10523 [Lasius niger]|uniref:Uncharacterized protein n=1 Tax=Lasius niger TaxID=67767 RepID=A0A0J7KHS3_LASNI|nr:hypothetical protein RF55_10523 [Lasius niger]